MRGAFVLLMLAALAGCGADGKPIAPGSKAAAIPVTPSAGAPGTGPKGG